MAFSIKNDETDAVLREVTALTGESLTAAVTCSLRERLDRIRRVRCDAGVDPLAAAIADSERCPCWTHDPRTRFSDTTSSACPHDYGQTTGGRRGG